MNLRNVARRIIKKKYLPWSLNIESMDSDKFVDLSYQIILRRTPDTGGRKHFLKRLEANQITKDHFLDTLIDSSEFADTFLYSNLSTSIHQSRIRFIRQLPASDYIVDLGGSSQDCDRGALVNMGYPYPFKKLTIIDLPIEKRHEIYQNNREVKEVDTHLGPVSYLYQSMDDLSPIPDNSVDLVYSGQTIEHVTKKQAQKVYKETLRVLKPGGTFALDTPNGRITRIQQDDFIDPDHKIEYTYEELYTDLKNAGFNVTEAKGLNYAGAITKRSQFSPKNIAKNCGIYSDIENCYLLAFVCKKD